MGAEHAIDLDAGLPVTPADRAALRELRAQSPSWLDWDWRVLAELVPEGTLAGRPIANDDWQPFVLAE